MSADKRVSVNAQMTEGFAVRADIRGHQVVIDQPEAARGQNQGPTPLEFFYSRSVAVSAPSVVSRRCSRRLNCVA